MSIRSRDVNERSVKESMTAILAFFSTEGIPKDRANTTQNYKFRGIDDVLEALSAQLAAERLLIAMKTLDRQVIQYENKSGTASFNVAVRVEYTFTHADTDSAIDCFVCDFYGEGMDSGDKATNKAYSSAYKNMALLTFCIPTEGASTDSENDSHDIKPAAQQLTDNWMLQLKAHAEKYGHSADDVKAWLSQQKGRSANDIYAEGCSKFGKRQ